MALIEVLQKLLFGLFLGGIIGLEREKLSRNNNKFAGFRTFALLGMSGTLLWVVSEVNEFLFWILGIGLAALLVASYVISSITESKDIGGTTEVASFIVLAAGYLAGTGHFVSATIVTVITLIILYSKKYLHLLAHKITRDELTSIIQFVIIALIILPLLPNNYMGPLNAFNPYVIWLMVVLISGISFLSYLGIKFVGAKKGISLTGFLGGLMSSTAVAMSFSERSKKYKSIKGAFVFGIIISGSAMFFRVLLEVFVVNRALISSVWPPLVLSGIAGIAISALIWFFWVSKEKSKEKIDVETGRPLDLKNAIKFGLLFALVILISKYASTKFGNEGIYITSIIAGMVDTDAITVSMANLAKGKLSNEAASIAIALGALSNTLTKSLIVLGFARHPVNLSAFGAFAVITGVGLTSLVFMI